MMFQKKYFKNIFEINKQIETKTVKEFIINYYKNYI